MTDKSRQAQEEMYRFPYHYLIRFELEEYRSFSQFKNNPGGFRYASYLIRTLEEVARHKFESLIDIGCGDGFFLSKLSEKYPSKTLVGVDLSRRAIEFARLLNAPEDDKEPKVKFLCRDIIKDPLGRQFDLATCIHVLEHIPPELLGDLIEAVRELISDQGKFIVLVPTKNIPLEQCQRHYQHFDEQSLTDMLSECFHVERIEYLNNDRFWGRIISRCLSNRLFILNHSTMRDWLFKLYLRRFLRCSKFNGYTLFAVCQKR